MSACKILLFLYFALCIMRMKCEVLYVRAGGEVTMECKVPPNTDVDWKLNDKLIVGLNGRRGTLRKGQIPVTDKAKINEDGLKITSLGTGDSGIYSCTQTEKTYTLHVVSVFVKPGSVLLQSSDAKLHCNIEGNTNMKVQWLRPPNDEEYDDRNQIIHLKSVTSKEEGQWTCSFNDMKLSVTLTVVGLQTKDVEVPEGGNIELACSLTGPVSQRVVGGKWKADHLPRISFPTLTNTEDKGLHWNGENSSTVTFTRGQLSSSYDVTLRNVQPDAEGNYVCIVEFDGGVKLTSEMKVTVTSKPQGERRWTKEVFGLQLWIWIIVGPLIVVVIILLIVIVLVYKRNKRMKRKKKLRQALTAKDYCQCKRLECDVKLGHQERPLPVPRLQRNPRTADPNHTTEY